MVLIKKSPSERRYTSILFASNLFTAIIDPFFIKNSPAEIIRNSAIDACAQCTEAYDSKLANPYTKLLCEKIINNACDQNNINGISLRYFNPIGYHTSKLFSDELTEDVGSIMQQIIKVALGREKFLNIYGSDYSTKDGTCERDFIHIEDVLDAHIKSIKYIDSSNGHEIFNIGTGLPISILKLINFFIKKNNIPINYEFTERKLGDIESCYADVEKINKKMKWKASKNIEDMVADAWKAHSK